MRKAPAAKDERSRGFSAFERMRTSVGMKQSACGWEMELAAWAGGAVRVAGVDEVGRGPLFGPVVAAAVVLPAECAGDAARLAGLNDSKLLKEAERERLAGEIRELAVAWAVARVDAATIDCVNIREATRMAMRMAIGEVAADFALVDGNCAVDLSGLSCGQRTVVKGDRLSMSIAAASVVAKVDRDALMRRMDAEFPGYGLARHKGYGTAEHLAALRRLGATVEHRRSFRPVREALG